MLETRHSNVEFLGKDGFHWFIAQVAPDKVWRDKNNQNFDNGFRAKIRILGHHPGENEDEGGISDENLPWAHFLVSPQFGAGNNYTGTSFALQGGEMVIGFFLDGEEGQQPVVIGSFYANYNIEDLTSYKEALEKGTTGFKALEIDPNIEYGDHIQIQKQEKILQSGGVVDSNEEVLDENKEKKKVIEEHFDNKSYHVPKPEICTDPSKKSGGISKTLQKFFDKVNELDQFSDGWIDPVLNKIVDMDELIDDASQEVSQAMSGIIRGARFKMFEEINEAVDDVVDFLTPDFLEKSIETKKKKDEIFCAIENILNGLKNVVGDFLKGLIGNILNAPLCAAEQFLSGLMSKLTMDIQNMIAPLLSGLSKFTGKAMPDFKSMMTKAMEMTAAALALFECEDQKCDADPADFLTNIGPDKKKKMDKKGLLSKFTQLSGSKLVGGISNLPGLAFPNSVIGDTVGSFSGGSPLEGLVGGCNVSSKQCGPPRIEIFGGGGFGAVADAVINETGKIIGVNMKDMGFGYTEAPYVTMIDDCNNGKGATGIACMDGDMVMNICILDPGGGYLSEGVSDSEGVDVIGEIIDVTIISTGSGYEDGDLVVSESGQALTPIIEDGRIVGVKGKIDQGLTDIPKLTVQTNTGFGAKLLPVTRFVKREEYTDPVVPEAELVTVISCPRFY
jgi:hypothetical protein